MRQSTEESWPVIHHTWCVLLCHFGSIQFIPLCLVTRKLGLETSLNAGKSFWNSISQVGLYTSRSITSGDTQCHFIPLIMISRLITITWFKNQQLWCHYKDTYFSLQLWGDSLTPQAHVSMMITSMLIPNQLFPTNFSLHLFIRNINLIKNQGFGTSQGAQWLRFHHFNAEGVGVIPGHGTKIPHAPWHGQKDFLKLK